MKHLLPLCYLPHLCHQVRLQTLIAINSAPCKGLIPSFCIQPSEVAMLFDWNLSRGFFFFWTCSQFLCPNFTQRLMIYRTALVSNKFQQNLSKFHFTWEKNQLSQPKNLQSIYTILTLELSQYYKSGSTFSSIADSCNCYLFANTLCFCFSVWPAEAVQECGQKI